MYAEVRNANKHGCAVLVPDDIQMPACYDEAWLKRVHTTRKTVDTVVFTASEIGTIVSPLDEYDRLPRLADVYINVIHSSMEDSHFIRLKDLDLCNPKQFRH